MLGTSSDDDTGIGTRRLDTIAAIRASSARHAFPGTVFDPCSATLKSICAVGNVRVILHGKRHASEQGLRNAYAKLRCVLGEPKVTPGTVPAAAVFLPRWTPSQRQRLCADNGRAGVEKKRHRWGKSGFGRNSARPGAQRVAEVRNRTRREILHGRGDGAGSLCNAHVAVSRAELVDASSAFALHALESGFAPTEVCVDLSCVPDNIEGIFVCGAGKCQVYDAVFLVLVLRQEKRPVKALRAVGHRKGEIGSPARHGMRPGATGAGLQAYYGVEKTEEYAGA